MDEAMVAEALTNFTEVFNHLGFEDKTRLFDLLCNAPRALKKSPEV